MMNFNITIVKNDDFKTVGFHVYAEKKQIFSWGGVQVICITTK